MPAGSVAVLLFSLSSTQEARRKSMTGSVVRDQRVWQSLERLTFAKIRSAGLPGFISHKISAHLSGTFGEQLQQAAKAVLDLGYDSVICIGNDCPALRPADLTEAAGLLQSGSIPIGTDKRGGVYLTGFNRASLTSEAALIDLSWQTATLATDLIGYLRERGQQTALLSASHADWNVLADTQLSQATGLRTWLYQLAEALCPATIGSPPVHTSTPYQRSIAPSGLRAPPVVVTGC
ncbi:DUF2064 domain-containing protein [uncultured Fibrella sp.]|uniref:DUF2064 domain-containing protein n=1 Tax=uncultured Fibrella sp. TaxID=1284596 RepID=UPI0035C9DBCA